MDNEKRLIDVDAFRDHWNKNFRHQYANDTFLFAIANFPTVDAVPVVRCKDCKHHVESVWNENDKMCVGWGEWIFPEDNDFCSIGERRTDV